MNYSEYRSTFTFRVLQNEDGEIVYSHGADVPVGWVDITDQWDDLQNKGEASACSSLSQGGLTTPAGRSVTLSRCRSMPGAGLSAHTDPSRSAGHWNGSSRNETNSGVY